MAQLKKGHKTHLKAGTLLETLVGLVIIVACFAVGTLIYHQVLNSSASAATVKAELQLLCNDGEAFAEETVKPHDELKGVHVIDCRIVNAEGKILATGRRVKP